MEQQTYNNKGYEPAMYPAYQGGESQPGAYPPQQQQYPQQQQQYPYQQPQSGYPGYPGTQTVVVNQQAPPPPQDQGRIQCLLGMGIFTTVCCNLLCGIPAVILAWLAMSSRDTKARKSQATCSMALSIVGIVSGVLTFIGVIVFYSLFWGSGFGYPYYYYGK